MNERDVLSGDEPRLEHEKQRLGADHGGEEERQQHEPRENEVSPDNGDRTPRVPAERAVMGNQIIGMHPQMLDERMFAVGTPFRSRGRKHRVRVSGWRDGVSRSTV